MPLSSQLSIFHARAHSHRKAKFIVLHRVARCSPDTAVCWLAGTQKARNRQSTESDREKKRWIFTSTDDSLLVGKAAHFRPAEENQECPHCRTTASVQFNHRRKYNEHRPTFCRFSNLFLARSAHSPRFGEFYLLFASSPRIFAYDPREERDFNYTRLNSPHSIELPNYKYKEKEQICELFFLLHFLICLRAAQTHIFSLYKPSNRPHKTSTSSRSHSVAGYRGKKIFN